MMPRCEIKDGNEHGVCEGRMVLKPGKVLFFHVNVEEEEEEGKTSIKGWVVTTFFVASARLKVENQK